MSLTFVKVETGNYRADGATFSYLIDQDADRPAGARWRLRIFRQVVLHFASDNTTLTTLGELVGQNSEPRLSDAKAVAQAFETSEFSEHNAQRRLGDALDRAYRALGYTRCGCETDPGNPDGPERVLTHSLTCDLHPEYDGPGVSR